MRPHRRSVRPVLSGSTGIGPDEASDTPPGAGASPHDVQQ